MSDPLASQSFLNSDSYSAVFLPNYSSNLILISVIYNYNFSICNKYFSSIYFISCQCLSSKSAISNLWLSESYKIFYSNSVILSSNFTIWFLAACSAFTPALSISLFNSSIIFSYLCLKASSSFHFSWSSCY